MAIAGVIGDQIDDHLQPDPVGVLEEAVEAGQIPEGRIDVAVVGHVVAEVRHG